LVLPLLIIAVGAAAGGLAFFQPWKLWVDQTVQEAGPVGLPPLGALPRSASPGSGPATAPGSTASASPAVLGYGKLISHEHQTTGLVRLVRLADGARLLRLDDLDTSNGPDLHVWLTDAVVTPDGWHAFDDGDHLDLGRLKGNRGDQNYPIPGSVDLSRYVSVTIWCDRFNVSFGAAALTAG
jgi:hypothetical protein